MWLYACKEIRLSGSENREQIRHILIQNVKSPALKFGGREMNIALNCIKAVRFRRGITSFATYVITKVTLARIW